ncbi:uncharacterized protein EDB91DRAFT_1120912 [Suillus paluster]|uniref:uncharacterized protein n=1 Tax=Suillus paluster TaxID=48578 RepID=UPI001B8772FB|nr:uncharacterized protein EDB91DRAFT_1120912 [Suillus paluster]KAG1745445.1 hypothetical protein EDB91DRAFT_1120912 [Suillus paluster]
MVSHPPNRGGYYKIRNVEFDTQYVDLKQGNARPGTLIVGHREDNSPGGIQNRTWQILYQSKGPLTATIRNPVSASYATVDDLNGNVVGNGDPQEFELIKTSYGYRIKVKGSTDVWILDSKEDLTKIHVISPPSESDKKQYWILESS